MFEYNDDMNVSLIDFATFVIFKKHCYTFVYSLTLQSIIIFLLRYANLYLCVCFF